MKVLVTGGCGFLGRQVVAHLRDKGHEVFSFDYLDSRCGPQGLPDRQGDVIRFSSVRDAVAGINAEAIIHLAAYGRNLTCHDFPSMAWDTNVVGTWNIMGAAGFGKVKRVVCCSSNIVLSPKPTLYKLTKQINEQTVEYFQSLGLSCCALRPSNIAGPGQSRTEYQPCSFAGLDMGFERDGHFSITGDGSQTRDFIHVFDVARAFGLALESDYCGPALDICTGRQTSLNEVARILDVPVEYTQARPGDAQSLVSDPIPAYKALDFQAEIGIDQIIRDSFPSVLSRG